LKFIFYLILIDVSQIIIYAGDWVAFILSKLGKMDFEPPAPRISDEVKEFCYFCDSKTETLAEILWEKANRPADRKISDFRDDARAFLKNLLKHDFSSQILACAERR